MVEFESAKIENALCAVTLGSWSSSNKNFVDPYSGGGFLAAKNSHFQNNWYYHTGFAGRVTESAIENSYIKDCLFNWTTGVPTGISGGINTVQSSYAHAGIFALSMPNFVRMFTDNRFVASTYTMGVNNEYVGIVLKGSNIRLESPNMTLVYEYTNLKKGISSTHGINSLANSSSIYQQYMTDVKYPIRFTGVDKLWIRNCGVIETSNSSASPGYSIQVSGTSFIQFHDNYLRVNNGVSNSKYGLIIVNTNAQSNTISNNHFENYGESGFQGLNNNSGLELRCNNFISNKYDILSDYGTGLRKNQGLCNIMVHAPAGNTFSSYCPETETHYKASSNNQNVEYHHHSNIIEKPSCITTTKVTTNDCGYGLYDCPNIGYPDIDQGTITQEINYYDSLVNSIESNLPLSQEDETTLEYVDHKVSELTTLLMYAYARDGNIATLEGIFASANAGDFSIQLQHIMYLIVNNDWADATLAIQNLRIANSDTMVQKFCDFYDIIVDIESSGFDQNTVDQNISALVGFTHDSHRPMYHRAISYIDYLEHFATISGYKKSFLTQAKEPMSSYTTAKASNSINIYPNPSDNGVFYVHVNNMTSTSQFEDIDYVIFNQQGKLVDQGRIQLNGSNAPATIKMKNPEPGLYFCTMTSADGQITHSKLMVQ